jgi:quinol monooxygenase YgiN
MVKRIKNLSMKKIQITAKFKIHTDKVGVCKKIAAECVATVKQNEKDALQYDWFINPEQTEIVVRETYTDSNAVLAHLVNVSELLGQLLTMSDFEGEIYGNMSEELKHALAGLNIKVYSFYQGL